MEVQVLVAPEALDLDAREAFRRAGERAVDARSRGEMLVVDCSATRTVDSAGLGTLIVLQRRAAGRGVRLVLRGLREDLRLLFHLTRLDELFDLDPTPGA